MPASLPPLVLRNGAQIDNVLEMALEFVEHDGSYQSYDLAPVKQDEVLTEADIRVANAIIARMSPRVIAGIYARAPVINAALGEVPASASLATPDEAVPWIALEQLMRAMDGIPEVGLPRQTKVLHKKRPALIPILDSVLEKYLRTVDRMRRTGDNAHDAVDLMRSYKRELDATLPVLQSLQDELRRRGIDLTECRLLASSFGPTRERTRRSTGAPSSVRKPNLRRRLTRHRRTRRAPSQRSSWRSSGMTTRDISHGFPRIKRASS